MYGSASAIAGSSRCEGDPPTQSPAGSQCSVTANMRISSGATTNTGVEMPATANAIEP